MDRRCVQDKCSYYTQGGCKPCDDCKAKPFIINLKCQRCLKCEGVPDELRFTDDKKAKEEVMKKQLIDEMKSMIELIESDIIVEEEKPKEKIMVMR